MRENRGRSLSVRHFPSLCVLVPFDAGERVDLEGLRPEVFLLFFGDAKRFWLTVHGAPPSCLRRYRTCPCRSTRTSCRGTSRRTVAGTCHRDTCSSVLSC